ncbi:branched-chain amino acid transport protein AzlD [Bacteriovorax sp. BSW11_IV]|uniref:AzlD domain-containing protein n=1 Tax=Bacteriovorax sp. BSW11_IV TaxID=1353529 RepID=UPI00038A43C0|nr:AzlD domain-containing protein [Bacteriovorax sp. BSW11_IV]EQC43020.1 branched-chain amino acid transport protein AzlD [Bacteriovorax sp. BSW11_IV]
MTITEKIAFTLILIVSTQLTRLLPLIFQKSFSKFFAHKFFKKNLTDLIIFFLIVYCYRDFSTNPEYIIRVAVGVYAFAIHYLFERTLLSIFSATAIYMTLLKFIAS